MEPSSHDPELRRMKSWCAENDIPLSTAYERIKKHGLEIIKVGRGAYLPRATRHAIITGKVAA
jgi:hypothetical protein